MVDPATERATLEILEQSLAGYKIYPRMRLTNIVKGRTKLKWAMRQYQIDFSVLNSKGVVICVIELDDSSRDTPDGIRRDKNKNAWLREADIPIIRIRQPQDAADLKVTVDQYAHTAYNPNLAPLHQLTAPKDREVPNELRNRLLGIVLGLIAAILALMIVDSFIKNVTGLENKPAQATQADAAQKAKLADALREQREEDEETAKSFDAEQREVQQEPAKGKTGKSPQNKE